MKVKVLKDGEYIDVDVEVKESELTEQSSLTETEALNQFFKSLASSDTNSIAKIRAAAHNFLNNTQEV